jgi:hypothetical protein
MRCIQQQAKSSTTNYFLKKLPIVKAVIFCPSSSGVAPLFSLSPNLNFFLTVHL